MASVPPVATALALWPTIKGERSLAKSDGFAFYSRAATQDRTDYAATRRTTDEVMRMRPVPDVLPMLSAGSHRSPRSGACFMELASVLAGERWSDHPKCTDPALAELARCVNDVVPDDYRSRLSPMVPSVIGTGGLDRDARVALAARIVRDCAVTALPLLHPGARPLACALVLAEQWLGERSPEAAAALATQPEAHGFALGLLAENQSERTKRRAYLSRAVPQALRCVVHAVHDELGPDAPDMLAGMLNTAITTARAACGLDSAADGVTAQRWQQACDLIGVTS